MTQATWEFEYSKPDLKLIEIENPTEYQIGVIKGKYVNAVIRADAIVRVIRKKKWASIWIG